MQLRTLAFILVSTAGLTACGQTLGDQALGGAAIGAGTAAVTDGSIGTGAAIGAAGNVAYCQANPGKCS